MNRQTSKNKFKKDVVESMELALVHFKAGWSGACQIIEPLYNELAKSYGAGVKFYTINIEKSKGFEKEYGVIDFPTILFFKSGKVIDYSRGLVTRSVLAGKIENALLNNTNQ